MNELITTQALNLEMQISTASERLAWASKEEIARAILALKKTGCVSPDGASWDDMAKTYEFALAKTPALALKTVVAKFIRGEYQLDYRWMPKPPELAAMARAEAKALYEDHRRLKDAQASVAGCAGQRTYINQGDIPSVAAAKKRWKGVQPIAEDISFHDWRAGAKIGRWPVGAVFSAVLSKVFPGLNEQEQTERQKMAAIAVAEFRAKQLKEKVAQDAQEAEARDPDYWAKIDAMPDIEKITGEQKEFRQAIQKRLE